MKPNWSHPITFANKLDEVVKEAREVTGVLSIIPVWPKSEGFYELVRNIRWKNPKLYQILSVQKKKKPHKVTSLNQLMCFVKMIGIILYDISMGD